MINPEVDALIKKARSTNGGWSIESLSVAIGKTASHDLDGNMTLNGTYSITEIEAILQSAYMERSSAGMSR